jgi:WD40 repeat protein
VHAVTVSPDGARIVSGSADRTARTWRSEGGAEVAPFTLAAEVHAVAISPDGNTIATGGNGTVTLHDPVKNDPRPLAVSPGTTGAVASRRDGRSVWSHSAPVASLNRDGRVLVGRDREVHPETLR